MTDGKNEIPADEPKTARDERADPENRVRQGVTGHNVRYVLLISLVLLLACYFMIATFFVHD